MSEPKGYDRGTAQPRKRKTRSWTLSVVKVWCVESLPRLVLGVVLAWLVILFHTMFTEAAEFRGHVEARSGEASYLLIPQCTAPRPEDRWTTPWPEREILAGDTFRTGEGSTLTLRCSEQSLVRLEAGTLLVLAKQSFDRPSAARLRVWQLGAGALTVRSAVPVGGASRFVVRTGTAEIEGWRAFYHVDGSRVTVLRGTLDVRWRGRPKQVGEGHTLDLVGGQIRSAQAAELQDLQQADGQVPVGDTSSTVQVFLVDLEERVVLAHSGWLLGLLGHQPGQGNPLAQFSVFNSSRRSQCAKRLKDLHEAMSGQGSQLPASVPLDALDKLGADKERLELLRGAFYRGQLVYYWASGDQWKVVARATDREHTAITMNQNGVEALK